MYIYSSMEFAIGKKHAAYLYTMLLFLFSFIFFYEFDIKMVVDVYIRKLGVCCFFSDKKQKDDIDNATQIAYSNWLLYPASIKTATRSYLKMFFENKALIFCPATEGSIAKHFAHHYDFAKSWRYPHWKVLNHCCKLSSSLQHFVNLQNGPIAALS